MSTYLKSNKNKLTSRHYLRKATASNHWFDFASNKVSQFIKRFGDDFCLIVNGSDIFDDAYILPYRSVKSYFKSEYLDKRSRWIGTIIDHKLKIGIAPFSIQVQQYYNNFNLLEM
jgi:hypothetical protein